MLKKASPNKDRHKKKINITDQQVEIFARRLLPQIKKFFADENIQKEFEEWKKKRQDAKGE